MAKKVADQRSKPAPGKQNKPIQKSDDKFAKKKQFKSMQDKLKKRGFSERVNDKSDKGAICNYLNEEIHRHVKLLQDQRQKNIASYEAERTRIRRQARQE